MMRAATKRATTKRATSFNAAMKRAADFGGGIAAYDRGDYAIAFGEMKPLAEQGDADSQNNLGVLYYHGQGVPQDYVQAHMWFKLSAAGLRPGKELDSAAENRDNVANLMTPAQIAEAQRQAGKWRPPGQSGATPHNEPRRHVAGQAGAQDPTPRPAAGHRGGGGGVRRKIGTRIGTGRGITGRYRAG